jgi:uncharacterized protein DUF6484
MKQPLAVSVQNVDVSRRIEGVRVGKVIGVEPNSEVLVDFPGNEHGPLTARFANALKLEILQKAASSYRDVLLIFENNDPQLPIILDTLHSYLDEITEAQELDLVTEEPQDVTVDGKRISFDAKEEIVLRCGKASITLTKAGKVLIRGAYLLSRSSGSNRIKGGSVNIN